MVSFLNVNRSLQSVGGAARHYRLPRRSPLALLFRRAQPVAANAAALRAPVAVLLAGERTALPEMTTEILDWRCEYAVENVKLERTRRQPLVAQVGWTERLRRLWRRPAAARL